MSLNCETDCITKLNRNKLERKCLCIFYVYIHYARKDDIFKLNARQGIKIY